MLNIALFNQNGEKLNDLELNENVFGIEPNNQAIFDVVLLQRASLRQGTHKVKNRHEVSGGGKKPWRQKGTGRARQGSIRAPQWRGGGIVFGPTPRSYDFKINKKVKNLALRSVLSQKVIDQELVALDDKLEENLVLSARNVPGVKVIEASNVNVYDVMDCTKLMMTEKAIKAVEEVLK